MVLAIRTKAMMSFAMLAFMLFTLFSPWLVTGDSMSSVWGLDAETGVEATTIP